MSFLKEKTKEAQKFFYNQNIVFSALHKELLEPGELPLYDKTPEMNTYVLSKNQNHVTQIGNPHRFYVPLSTFSIDGFDSKQDLTQSFKTHVEKHLMGLLHASSFDERATQWTKEDYWENADTKICSVIGDLAEQNLIDAHRTGSIIRNMDRSDRRPLGIYETPLAGRHLYLIKEEPSNVGKFVIRTNVAVMETDEEPKVKQIFMCAGMVIFNPSAIIRVDLDR